MPFETESSSVPTYHLLSKEQILEIHTATLDLLERVGVRIQHEEAIGMLLAAGCHLDERNMIHFPARLVENCLSSVPHSITIYDRNGGEAMQLGGRNSYYGPGTDLIYTTDLETGLTRKSLLKDVANASIVSDYCEQIDFTASFALPDDVPVNSMYLRCFKAMVENTTKPIFCTAAGSEDLAYILEMAQAVVGGEAELRKKPFLIHYSQPVAPLIHSYGAANKVLFCAGHEIPLCYPPTLILGVSAPVTLAGAVVQANAMVLSGIVLHQLKKAGAPVIMGWAVTPIDMRTTNFLYGAPEWRLTNSAFADVLHHYNIPMWSTVGSDANTLDTQAAVENTAGLLMAALDGANLIHDVGYLGQGRLGNPASILMGAETIGYIKRILAGITLNKETLAADLVAQVGADGNFLTSEHTHSHHRGELWRPRYANRDNLEVWVQKGGRRYEDVLAEKTLEILARHKPQPLSAEVMRDLERISAEADDALAKIEFVA